MRLIRDIPTLLMDRIRSQHLRSLSLQVELWSQAPYHLLLV